MSTQQRQFGLSTAGNILAMWMCGLIALIGLGSITIGSFIGGGIGAVFLVLFFVCVFNIVVPE